jgi:uncharacterized membrane protein
MYNPRSHYSAPTALGIDERLERVLCYVGLWVTGLIFLVLERRNATVRRHAMQSLLVFGTLSVILFILSLFGGALGAIPLIGWVFGIGFGLIHGLVWIAGAILWVFLMIAAWFSPATFIGDRYTRYV